VYKETTNRNNPDFIRKIDINLNPPSKKILQILQKDELYLNFRICIWIYSRENLQNLIQFLSEWDCRKINIKNINYWEGSLPLELVEKLGDLLAIAPFNELYARILFAGEPFAVSKGNKIGSEMFKNIQIVMTDTYPLNSNVFSGKYLYRNYSFARIEKDV